MAARGMGLPIAKSNICGMSSSSNLLVGRTVKRGPGLVDWKALGCRLGLSTGTHLSVDWDGGLTPEAQEGLRLRSRSSQAKLDLSLS